MGSVIRPEEFDSGAAQARAELARQIADGAQTVEAVARGTGLPVPVLAAWLKLSGGADPIGFAPRALAFLDLNASGPLGDFVMTRAARQVMAAVTFTRAMVGMSIIWGDAGVGKTTALAYYRDTHPGEVIWVTGALPHGRPVAFLDDVLRAAGLPTFRNGDGFLERLRCLVDALRGGRRNALLIVDEAQRLGPETLDLVRSIHDEGQVPIVLAGNERVYNRLHGKGHPGWAQLFSRLTIQCRLSRRVYVSDVRALGGGALPEDCVKYLGGLAQRGGGLRSARNCLRLAWIMAAAEGEGVTLESLKAAQEMLVLGGDDEPDELAETPAAAAAVSGARKVAK